MPTNRAPTPPCDIDWVEAIARHECGHALLAVLTGMRTRWMRIRVQGRSVEGGTEVASEDFDQAERRAILLLSVAGMQATAIWLQRAHHWPARQAWAYGSATGCDDQKMFRHYARGTSYTMARACSETDRILRAHWPRVDRVAGVLAVRRKLAAAKVA